MIEDPAAGSGGSLSGDAGVFRILAGLLLAAEKDGVPVLGEEASDGGFHLHEPSRQRVPVRHFMTSHAITSSMKISRAPEVDNL